MRLSFLERAEAGICSGAGCGGLGVGTEEFGALVSVPCWLLESTLFTLQPLSSKATIDAIFLIRETDTFMLFFHKL